MSKVNTDGLNETYPTGGKDNSTQGFRDNFSNIKTNLNYIKEELEKLEQNALSSGEDADFKGLKIIDANLKNCTVEAVTGGTILTDFSLKYTEGQYHSYMIKDHAVISLDDWPPDRYAKITVELTGDSKDAVSVQFKGPNYTNTIKYDIDWPNPDSGHVLQIENSTTHIIDFWSTNGGLVVYTKYIGRY